MTELVPENVLASYGEALERCVLTRDALILHSSRPKRRRHIPLRDVTGIHLEARYYFRLCTLKVRGQPRARLFSHVEASTGRIVDCTDGYRNLVRRLHEELVRQAHPVSFRRGSSLGIWVARLGTALVPALALAWVALQVSTRGFSLRSLVPPAFILPFWLLFLGFGRMLRRNGGARAYDPGALPPELV